MFPIWLQVVMAVKKSFVKPFHILNDVDIPAAKATRTDRMEKKRKRWKKKCPLRCWHSEKHLPSKTPQPSRKYRQDIALDVFHQPSSWRPARASPSENTPIVACLAIVAPSEGRRHREPLFARKEAKGRCAFTMLFVTSMHRFISFVYLCYAASFISVGGGWGTGAVLPLPLSWRYKAMPI